MNNHLDIPHNAMEILFEKVLWPATVFLAATIFGFLFKNYQKSINDKFSDIKESTDSYKEEMKAIVESLQSIKIAINDISNALSKMDYRLIILEGDVKEQIKKVADLEGNMKLIKSFHSQHHKDDKF